MEIKTCYKFLNIPLKIFIIRTVSTCTVAKMYRNRDPFLKKPVRNKCCYKLSNIPFGMFHDRAFFFCRKKFPNVSPNYSNNTLIRLQKVSKSSDNFLKNSAYNLKMLMKCSFKFSNNPMNILMINWVCFFLQKKNVPHASPSCLKKLILQKVS